MLDIKFIRENPKLVKKALLTRGVDLTLVEQVLKKYEVKVSLAQKTDLLRARLNEISKDPGWLKNGKLIQPAGEIKKELQPLEKKLKEAETEFKELLCSLPNLPLEGVPFGDETKNEIIKTVGKPQKFDFNPKDHLELAELHDLIDVPRATKISGSRFAYLKNQLVILEFALIQLAFEKLIKEDFIPIIPPALIKKEITEDLGYWQRGGNENYYLVSDFEKERSGIEHESLLYLIGTGEHSVVPMHSGEIFNANDLPRKYAAFSPCFRREAGTYGKDTRGILRVHQFDKIEMVSFVKPQDDQKERGKMLTTSEDLMKSLELPYQLVKLASGDLGFPAAETIDIETWIPSQKKYRETHSVSTTTSFQSRRMNIKYKEEGSSAFPGQAIPGQAIPGGGSHTEFVHILNGTALAIGRTLIAIMENYQQKDGSIIVPKVLQKYTGFSKIPA